MWNLQPRIELITWTIFLNPFESCLVLKKGWHSVNAIQPTNYNNKCVAVSKKWPFSFQWIYPHMVIFMIRNSNECKMLTNSYLILGFYSRSLRNMNCVQPAKPCDTVRHCVSFPLAGLSVYFSPEMQLEHKVPHKSTTLFWFAGNKKFAWQNIFCQHRASRVNSTLCSCHYYMKPVRSYHLTVALVYFQEKYKAGRIYRVSVFQADSKMVFHLYSNPLFLLVRYKSHQDWKLASILFFNRFAYLY